MAEVTGVCRFCNQTKFMEVPEGFYHSQVEIDEEATKTCKCREAKEYQHKLEHEEMIESAKLSAKGTTYELFHDEFPEIEKILNFAIDDLVNEKFKKITITTGGKTKANMYYKNKVIIVEREDKQKATRETAV